MLCKSYFFLSFFLFIHLLFFCISAPSTSILTLPATTACVDSLSGCQGQEAAMPGFTGKTQVGWSSGLTVSGLMVYPDTVPKLLFHRPLRVIHSFSFNKRGGGRKKWKREKERKKNICLDVWIWERARVNWIAQHESQLSISMPVLCVLLNVCHIFWWLCPLTCIKSQSPSKQAAHQLDPCWMSTHEGTSVYSFNWSWLGSLDHWHMAFCWIKHPPPQPLGSNSHWTAQGDLATGQRDNILFALGSSCFCPFCNNFASKSVRLHVGFG